MQPPALEHNFDLDQSLAQSLDQILKSKFNLETFRKGQKEIIASIINKRDVLAVLPTGGGKSLCYQLPAVVLDQLVVVVSPLIALMKDQVYALNKIGLNAGCRYSGQTLEESKIVFKNIENSKAFILYLSPERVQHEGFLKWIVNRDVALFAIDEAHCVSQWGHDFREEYSMLKVLKKIRPDVPMLALTASATPEVLNDIAKNLNLKNPERRVHGFYRPNLFYQVEKCVDANDKMNLIQQALYKIPEGRKIIYAGTRKNVQELAAELSKIFENVGYYHAGLSSEKRTKMQSDYQQGAIKILVATNAFGMGIDQPDVRLVIHYQMPASIDSLYQEMGRAGRDTLPANCLMLYSKKDKGLQSYFITEAEATPDIKKSRWRSLDALIDYIESSECRHAEVLTYYKDPDRIKSCGHCDNCCKNSERLIKKLYENKKIQHFLKKKKKNHSNDDMSKEFSSVQQNKFELLKIWRKEKATELDLPAFVIFSDQTLKNIVLAAPRNKTDLLSIHGVGSNKIENFGDAILKILIN